MHGKYVFVETSNIFLVAKRLLDFSKDRKYSKSSLYSDTDYQSVSFAFLCVYLCCFLFFDLLLTFKTQKTLLSGWEFTT